MSDAASTVPNVAHFQGLLAGLADRAAAAAHGLADRIGHADAADALRLAKAFECASMTARRTILLSVHLHKAAEKEASLRTAGRMRILREIGDSIARDKLPPAQADALRVELVERLDSFDLSPALDRELALRPAADVVVDFKRDMGLDRMPGARPWPRRTPDDIADLLAQAQKPAQPWPPGSFRQQN